MKRKVVKHGPATLIVSIPSGWAKKYGIKQGDELDVDEQGSRLVIDVKKEQAFPEFTIDTTNLSRKLIERFLINSYQLGYDKVNIIYDDPKLCTLIQDKLQQLIGFDLIERSNEGCVIKNIATKIDLDFKNSLKKVFLLVDDVITTTYEAYKNNDKKILNNLHYKDLDINKYAYFCLRSINKQQYIGDLKEGTHVLYHIIIKVENLADYYKKLSKLLARTEKDREIQGLLLDLKTYYKGAFDFFYNPKKEKLETLLKIDNHILRSIKKSFSNTKAISKLLILTLMNNITQSIYRIPIRTLNRLNINETFIKEY